jgi:hypothetical protein
LSAALKLYSPDVDLVTTMKPYQADFVSGDTRFVSIVGAKGSSKTWSGARFIIAEIQRQPRQQGLLMWNTLQQARDVYYQDIEPLIKDLGLTYSFNQSTMILNLEGSIIHFRSAEADVIKRIESIAYSWGWADEASFFPDDSLRTFVSRIRKGEARIRITSMPDDPDAFIYSFLEKQGATIYEIGLADNPDKKFRERYEAFLRSTYEGAMLDRFLYGKRVSLTGMGAFAVDAAHRVDVAYDPNADLYLSWDFNVEYRAVSAWQLLGLTQDAKPLSACVRSWQMKQPTVYEDAQALCEELKSHKGNLILLGDASGANRTALTTSSMWSAVKDIFSKAFGDRLRYRVPQQNPSVKDTVQCVNWALRNDLVRFDSKERNVFQSLSAAKLDKYGDIDKSGDNKPSGAKSHETDTARYFLWEIYGRMYPGNRNSYWIV